MCSGSGRLDHAHIMYILTELKISELASKLKGIGVICILSVCLPPAIYPILYALLEYPTPDKWRLALPMK